MTDDCIIWNGDPLVPSLRPGPRPPLRPHLLRRLICVSSPLSFSHRCVHPLQWVLRYMWLHCKLNTHINTHTVGDTDRHTVSDTQRFIFSLLDPLRSVMVWTEWPCPWSALTNLTHHSLCECTEKMNRKSYGPVSQSLTWKSRPCVLCWFPMLSFFTWILFLQRAPRQFFCLSVSVWMTVFIQTWEPVACCWWSGPPEYFFSMRKSSRRLGPSILFPSFRLDDE